jgi:hypothetical protein
VKRLAWLGLALLGLSAAAEPDTVDPPTPPSEACTRITAEIERAGQARKQAAEKGDNAWKTVLPFAVIARKASSKAAVAEADKQLGALRRQFEAEGCSHAG